MFRPLMGLLALAAAPLAAQDNAAHCAGLGETAAKVMEARQVGVAEGDLLALARDGAAADSLVWIIGQAYEEPAYPAPAQQAAAMSEFARAVEAACLRG